VIKRLFIVFGALLIIPLLAACGATTGGPTGEQTNNSVQVTETEYKIDSSVTNFTPGTTYHFVVTNNGQTTHEFMIMPKSEGNMNGMPMGKMDKMALASIDNISPGEIKTLDYTFPSSASNSQPEFACYLPGHYEAGMKIGVIVKA
jgi:uncharacterized cupredoxin-like copper-binding protein